MLAEVRALFNTVTDRSPFLCSWLGKSIGNVLCKDCGTKAVNVQKMTADKLTAPEKKSDTSLLLNENGDNGQYQSPPLWSILAGISMYALQQEQKTISTYMNPLFVLSVFSVCYRGRLIKRGIADRRIAMSPVRFDQEIWRFQLQEYLNRTLGNISENEFRHKKNTRNTLS